MVKFKVFEAVLWPDGDSFSVNQYYLLLTIQEHKQLTIELSDNCNDADIINALINNGIINSCCINQSKYSIDIEYLYNDIIVTFNLTDINTIPIIIKLCEV